MLETVRLICDSGLLILIWMVQLIVYPSFSFYSEDELFKWHTTYTKRIALIVIPLMLGQLITVSLQVFSKQDFYTLTSCVMVLLVWLSTFLQFVPLHANISRKQNLTDSVAKLAHQNWVRTILWSLLFTLSCYFSFKP